MSGKKKRVTLKRRFLGFTRPFWKKEKKEGSAYEFYYMVILLALLSDSPRFDHYALLRREMPVKLYLFPLSKNGENYKVQATIETILDIETILEEIEVPTFPSYLKAFYEIMSATPEELFLIIGTKAPPEFLLAAFVTGAFFEVRIYLQDHEQEFIVPNQDSLQLVQKKGALLRIIQAESPDSLEGLLNTLLERKMVSGVRKNLRTKISYTLGLLEEAGLVTLRRLERGKLKAKLTAIGAELLKNIT